MELKDKVIVITGASGGIGQTMARQFAAKGAQLALVDMNPERLLDLQKSCEAQGVRAETYVVDVSKEAKVEMLFEQVVRDFGALDGLVNNAGITRDSLLMKKKGDVFSKMSLEQWQQVIDVNLTGVFLCGREASIQMAKLEKPGVIVNISSICRVGNMGQTNYSATKAGVDAMTSVWAKELSRYNIRVGAIAPGYIGTEMVNAIRPDVQDKMKANIPLRRFGEPEEISQSALFIFENDFFTGRILEVDGGMRI